jgi:hypothetical protein
MISNDGDLDHRLGELFADRNLALPPVPGATGLVLARVGRARRRRRAIRIAVPVVVGLLLGGAALSDLGSRLNAAPVSPAGTSAPLVSAEAELAMSGSSVGALQLGMSRSDAEASGLLKTPGSVLDAGHPGCWVYQGHRGIENVQISSRGVTSIQVYTFIRTAQDAGIGDTFGALRAEFPASLPAVPSAETSYRVPVPGQPGAWYVFTFDTAGDPLDQQSRVTGLALENDDRSCD